MSLEQRSREDLEQRVEELERKRIEDNELRAQVEGELRQRLTELENAVDELQEEIDEARSDAAAAYSLAAENEDETKVGHARALVRNELVRRAAIDVAMMDRPITNGEAQDKALPEVELDWQTVDDAFGDLLKEWPCFRRTEKRGEKALTVDKDGITRDLTRLVEHSLGRSDLTKEILGG
jgi:hypothetical protein